MPKDAITVTMEMWNVNNVFNRKETTVMDYELDEDKIGGGETNSRVSWNSGRVLFAKGDTEDIKEALDDQATRMGR